MTAKANVNGKKMINVGWKSDYSFMIGLGKTAKNSAYLLIPFGLAILANVPIEYAWITGPIVYFFKNFYENKIKLGG